MTGRTSTHSASDRDEVQANARHRVPAVPVDIGMPPAGAATAAAESASSAGAAATPASGKFTWQEVANHNTAQSAWVIVDDGVYDLTGFVDKHPGGKEMMLLAAGRDCTDLFAMYHVFNEEKARKYLASYRIGSLTGPTEFPRYAPDASGFWRTLKGRVVDHFKATGKDPRNPLWGMLAMVPVYTLFITVFAVVHDGAWLACPLPVKLALAAALGVLQVLPLLHWLHDASHGSIGNSEGWWKFAGRASMDYTAGASIMSWHHQHIIGHHVMTNVFGADPDLPVTTAGDLRRIVPAQFWTSLYRYQHIYLPVLYGLLGLKFRIQDVTDFMIKKTNGPVRVNWYDNVWFRIVVTKLLWLTWRAGIPLLVWRQSLGAFLGFFLITELFSGFWLAYNFQVSHITTDVDWPNGKPGDNAMVLADSWAESQVKTSLDYAHGDGFWTYMCGALNYQIEHHLFPGISQYYLPEIAPIVKKTCQEYNIPYRYEKNFVHAFAAHIKFLKDMGNAGHAVHMD